MFNYTLKDPNSIWEKIKIHGNVITFYYRILRGVEGREKDEALFSVAPQEFTYIFDKDKEHQGLHRPSYSPQQITLYLKDPEVRDSTLLHRHIKLKEGVTLESILATINVFKSLEPVCAREGKYNIGQYVFLNEEDQAAFIKALTEYLNTQQLISKAQTQSALAPVDELKERTQAVLQAASATAQAFQTVSCSAENKPVISQFSIRPPKTLSKEELIRKHLTNKFGEKFMEKYGNKLIIENIGNDEYKASIILPLSVKGKEWFTSKLAECQFEITKEGQTKVIIPVSLISLDSVHKMQRTFS